MSANLHENRYTPDTLVVIDTYDWYDQNRRDGQPTDVLHEAMLLTNMANTHGLRVDFETITNEKDRERINSYKQLRHNVRSMNGSRPTELIEVIMDLVDRVNFQRPEKVIVVGDNEEFHLLCSAAERNNAHVQIWTPNPKLPPKLRRYEVHALEIVPSPARKTTLTVVVRLDVENHLITLHKRGYTPDARAYLDAVHKATADLGNTINIQAWADWKRLRQSLGRDYQHEFEQNGVKTFYQINEPGKSTSDVAMVGSIHESLDHDNGLDIYVIGTGDTDFTPVVESIRNQGKKVVVLTLEGSLGNKLRQAADEVRFLDSYLPGKQITSSKVQTSGEPNKDLVATLVVARMLRTRHWQYVFVDRLPNWLPVDWIQDAVETGLLMQRSPAETNCVVLNMDHPATRQAAYFEKWVQRQLHYYLDIRKFGWVDTAFLARGMQMDKGCQDLNIGRDRNSAIAMLEASTAARQLVKNTGSHPKHAHILIDTWTLPGDDPAAESDQSNLPAAHTESDPTSSQGTAEAPETQPNKKQESFWVEPLTEKALVTAF
jgi:hypothetical protein